MAQRLSDHSVEQLSPEYLGCLERSALLNVACNWVHDLKEMREQANQNPANSSRPPSTRAPWESGKKSVGAGAPQESGKNPGAGESDLAEPSESLDREDRKDQTEATEHSAAPETKTGSNVALTPVIHGSEKRKQGKQLGYRNVSMTLRHGIAGN